MYGILDLTWKPTAAEPTPPPGQAEAIVRGDTYVLVLAFWADPVAETGPVAIDGTVTAQVRAKRLTGDTDDEALADFAVVVSGVGVNIVTVSLTPAETLSLPPEGFWDLEAVDAGVTTTWLAGAVAVVNDVTRVGGS